MWLTFLKFSPTKGDLKFHKIGKLSLPANEMFAFNSEWCRPWRSRVLWNIHRAESFKRPQLTRKLHTAYA